MDADRKEIRPVVACGTSDTAGACADPLLGRTVGPCLIEALLGRGGMGAVYRARHIALDRPVALKVVAQEHLDSPEAVSAFLNEARIAARLEDPRIVQVYDVGMDGAQPYIVMQLVSGHTLAEEVAQNGPLSQKEALRVMKEVVGALMVAHHNGVVHRDVKPGNIMLGPEGCVRIMDFGLSVALGKSDSAQRMNANALPDGVGHSAADAAQRMNANALPDGVGHSAADAAQQGLAALGSFDFMAPEQGYGAAPDARMDLYSAGATYFYALAGRPPYLAKSAGDILLQHREAPVPDVREVKRDVTEAAAGLIRRLMSKDPAQRPASAQDMLRELNSPNILIEVDSSGSPFKLLPPPVQPKEGFEPPPMPAEAAAAPGPEPMPPPEPMPLPAPALKRNPLPALVIGAALLAAVAGQCWLRVSRQDWAAAGIAAAAATAVIFKRRQWSPLARVPAGILSAAVMAAAFYRYGVGSFIWITQIPDLDTIILAGLGLTAAGTSLYLGLWVAGPRDFPIALGLLSGAAAMLLAAAAAMGAPSGIPAALAADARYFVASGGPWRWGGLLIALCIIWMLLRSRADRQAKSPKSSSVSNWNR